MKYAVQKEQYARLIALIASMLEKRIHHEGLKSCRIVCGSTEQDVDTKVQYQLASWNARWQRVVNWNAIQQRIHDGVTSAEKAEDLANICTEHARKELEVIEGLLKGILSHRHRRNWTTAEINSVVKSWQLEAKPEPDDNLLLSALSTEDEDEFDGTEDAMYQDAVRVVLEMGKATTSILQRRLRLGYGRSARILDMMQREGIIGPPNGSNPREVLSRPNWLCDVESQSWGTELAKRPNTEFRRPIRPFVEPLPNKSTQQVEKLPARNLEINPEEQRFKRELYEARDPDALLEFWYDLLADFRLPDSWPDGCQFHYMPDTKTLVVDYEMPSVDLLPRFKEVRYIASRRGFKELSISETERKHIYDDAICQIALANVYLLLKSDYVEALSAIVFNGWVDRVDKATGAEIHPCILSLHVQKQEFLSINLAQVDARLCFKKLKGVAGSSLADASPVKPLLTLNKEDSRFVPAYNVAHTLDQGTNLAAIDWLDFENLIREIFEKEFSKGGGEVRITQASRDGGVDAVAFDPDPIRGGKMVIQAKRYTNTVGVSAVRDLYGTVHNEGAMKGILVTTSDFGPDAYEFAKGKPLTLISGSELLYLLERHGHQARINLTEAKQVFRVQ